MKKLIVAALAAILAGIATYRIAFLSGPFWSLGFVCAVGIFLACLYPDSARRLYRWPTIFLIFAFIYTDYAMVFIILALTWALWRTTSLEGDPGWMSPWRASSIRARVSD